MSEEHGKSGRGRHRVRAGAIAVAAVALAAGGLAASQANAATRAPAAAGTASHGTLSISKQFFGSTVEPYTGVNTATYRYSLTNDRGMTVDILSYGGIVQSIDLPGRNGAETDVVLGFKTLQEYVTEDSPPVTANGGPYFGETIGRYGNRIAKGTFTLSQPGAGPVTYTLPINNGVNDLHGGLVGFGDRPAPSSPTAAKSASPWS
jgi:aldose 1-epimerase